MSSSEEGTDRAKREGESRGVCVGRGGLFREGMTGGI